MAWSLATPEGVMHLQRGLNYAVWYSADRFKPVTGVMDADTDISVREFQRIWEMPITGNVTNLVMNRLEAEMNRKHITDW